MRERQLLLRFMTPFPFISFSHLHSNSAAADLRARHHLSSPFLHSPWCRRPALAVLDEVTAAVSEEAAQQLYGEMHADGITCVRWVGGHDREWRRPPG